MIYANDQWLLLPVKDLYDSLIMLASIQQAREMYKEQKEELDAFKKEYGDFMSPFSKDMDRYNEIYGDILKTINDLYEHGIDPLRSPEGRALISKAIRSVNVAEFNNMRANAKIGYEYLDALQKLNAQGKYDPNMNEYFLRSQGLPSFKNFSSANGATWNISSPIQAISLRDLTSPGFAHRTAHELTKDEAKRIMGSSFDPNAKYTGYTFDDVFRTAGTLVPGLRGDIRAEYFRELSKQKALLKNPNATEDDINKLFLEDIAESNRQWIIDPKSSLDDYFNRRKIALAEEANAIARDKSTIEKNKNTNSDNKIGWTDRRRFGFAQSVTEKGGYIDNLYQIRQATTENGAKQQLIAEGNKNPTVNDIQQRIIRNKIALGVGTGMSTNANNIYAQNYSAYTHQVTGNAANTARALAVNMRSDEIDENGGIVNIKKKPVTFEAGGTLSLLKLRHMAYANTKLTSGSITERLYDYLVRNRVSGYVFGDEISTSYKPYGGGHGVLDINFSMEITKESLDGFKKAYYNGDEERLLNSIKNTGAVLIPKVGKEVTADGKLKYEDVDKIVLPVSRTIDLKGFTESEINIMDEKLNIGASDAEKSQPIYLKQDVKRMSQQ